MKKTVALLATAFIISGCTTTSGLDATTSVASFDGARNGKQEATFKRYRPRGLNEKGVDYFELVPLNENYPIMRSDLEEITIIGTAVEHRKTL